MQVVLSSRNLGNHHFYKLTLEYFSIRNCNVIVLALALYSLRLLGYSFIDKPLESLFFEVLKPFGNSLLLIAAMTYAKNNADIETMASLEVN